MKKLLLTIFAVCFLTFCQNKADTLQNGDACQLATDFLNYYTDKYESISEVDPFVYEPIYRVDSQKLDQLIGRLKMQEFFTADFQRRFREKYSNIDRELKKNPQDDGTIDGFEADEFLFTQDIDEVLGWIKSGKFSCAATGEKVVVSFEHDYALEFLVLDGKIDTVVPKFPN